MSGPLELETVPEGDQGLRDLVVVSAVGDAAHVLVPADGVRDAGDDPFVPVAEPLVCGMVRSV